MLYLVQTTFDLRQFTVVKQLETHQIVLTRSQVTPIEIFFLCWAIIYSFSSGFDTCKLSLLNHVSIQNTWVFYNYVTQNTCIYMALIEHFFALILPHKLLYIYNIYYIYLLKAMGSQASELPRQFVQFNDFLIYPAYVISQGKHALISQAQSQTISKNIYPHTNIHSTQIKSCTQFHTHFQHTI